MVSSSGYIRLQRRVNSFIIRAYTTQARDECRKKPSISSDTIQVATKRAVWRVNHTSTGVCALSRMPILFFSLRTGRMRMDASFSAIINVALVFIRAVRCGRAFMRREIQLCHCVAFVGTPVKGGWPEILFIVRSAFVSRTIIAPKAKNI